MKQKTNRQEGILQDLSGKKMKKKIRIAHLSYYRRTRSKTMSERLRKSIRQKLRPSIFTVSIKIIIIIKILWIINLLHFLEPELFSFMNDLAI